MEEHEVSYLYSALGVTWRCTCGAYAYDIPATEHQARERAKRHLRMVNRLANRQLAFTPRPRAA